MDQLFKKAVQFTDIHFGLKNNSPQHSLDCYNFVEWLCEEGKAFDADTCIFTGDWHHSRHNLHVLTMKYSLSSLELLCDTFDSFYFIPGNHDLFYKERRDLSSIEWARNIKDIKIINDITTIGDVTFAPWLINDEYKTIGDHGSKYMFGHFEMPHFYMNKMFEMPDIGGMPHLEDFKKYEYVFSGHFHKQQVKGNFVYTGNTFPHDFSDAGDDNRGMMFLEWGQDPTFKAWPEAPKYRLLTLKQLLDAPEKWIDDKTHARVEIDIDISFEEATIIKETMAEKYGARKIELIQTNKELSETEFSDTIEFKSVDQLVVAGLRSFEKSSIDPEFLVELYLEL